jgi:uncharacterized membrane protein YedE/YeeE
MAPAWEFLVFLVIGVLIGIVLERGRFCFVTAFQETMEFRNPWILRAIFISIGVTALGVGAMWQFLGWAPPPHADGWFIVIGGFLFGTGIAMCGACATGQLFRAGSGYVANWMEVIGGGLGMVLYAVTWWEPVEKPALKGAPSVTVPAAVSVPPIVYALASAAFFIGLGLYLRRYLPQARAANYRGKGLTLSLKKPWHPTVAGVSLSVLMLALYAIGYATRGQAWQVGVTTAQAKLGGFLVDAVAAPLGHPVSTWPWFRGGRWLPNPWDGLLLAIIAGAFISSKIAGDFAIRIPRQRSKLLWYLAGGVIMGYGARMGLGCNIDSWYNSFAIRFDLIGFLFGLGMFPGVWLGTRLDEWVAERLWGAGGLLAPKRKTPAPRAVEERG